LGTYIEQGHSDAAARQAAQLASKGIRLHVNPSNNTRNENEFMYIYMKKRVLFFLKFIFLINRIQIQLDGNEYGIDQHGATIPVNVFSSTTVRELRAAVYEIHEFHIYINLFIFIVRTCISICSNQSIFFCQWLFSP
jgi:hypothetical protein